MSDASSIASQIIASLQVVEPDLDTSVGTTVRNIIDTFSEQQAQGYLDSNISDYAQAIDTKSGADLDQYVGQFGFTRFPAVRATGVVTLTQVTWANPLVVPVITIPQGSIFSTITGITFQTVATYSLPPDQTSIDVSVIAVVGGASGNVGAGAITGMATPLNGINAVSNAQATSGGADAESDSALINRFKATIFRSYTGTEQSFLGVALENSMVTLANVIGSVTTHQEQIEITAGSGPCVLDDIKFVYPDNQYLAQDLSTSTSDVVTGSLHLTTAITSGVSTSSIHVQAASGTVTIQPGTMFQIGPDTVTVSGTSAIVVDTTGETLPVNAYTPSATTPVGTITFVYNTGQFFTPGVHFNLITSALLTNPTLLPSVAMVAGTGFPTVGTNLSYKIAYANANGITRTIGVTYSTPTAGDVQLTLPSAQYSSPPDIMESLSIYIYGRTAGSEALLAVLPATTTTWTDHHTIVPEGAPPTVNTTGLQVAVSVLAGIPDGIYQVQFDYIPATSRNSYPSPLNCVDIYTNGTDVQSASEALSLYIGPQSTSGPITSTGPSFVGDITSPFFVGSFQRADGTNPIEGNWFLPLSFGPLVSLPTELTSPTGGSPVTSPATYHYGTDYWLVNEIGPSGMSNQSLSGIEIKAGIPIGNGFTTGSGGVPTNVGQPALLTVDYTFNAVPQEIYQSIQKWRLLSTDVMVHQAFPIYLNIYFVVVYSSGNGASTVNPNILTALQNAVQQVSFNQILEASSLLAAALSVPGVANLRFALSSDSGLTGFGVQAVSPTGTVVNQFVQPNGQVADIEFTSDTYPVINAVITKSVAQNAFMQGGIVPLRPT